MPHAACACRTPHNAHRICDSNTNANSQFAFRLFAFRLFAFAFAFCFCSMVHQGRFPLIGVHWCFARRWLLRPSPLAVGRPLSLCCVYYPVYTYISYEGRPGGISLFFGPLSFSKRKIMHDRRYSHAPHLYVPRPSIKTRSGSRPVSSNQDCRGHTNAGKT
jgi:hypothetical protein